VAHGINVFKKENVILTYVAVMIWNIIDQKDVTAAAIIPLTLSPSFPSDT